MPVLPSKKRPILAVPIRFLRNPPFVKVDVVEHRLDVGAIRRVIFREAFFQNLGACIIPAAFTHEFAPNFNLLVGWLFAFGETPLQNLFIRAALFHSLDQIGIVDFQKLTAAVVEVDAKVHLVLLWERALCVEANLIQHASEIDDSAGLNVRAAEIWNVHGL